MQTKPPRSTSPARWNSFALYLILLASMVGLYSLYARFAVPLIEGPVNITRREVHPPNVELSSQHYNRENLANLFPQDAWEHGECKVLSTEQGLVLFKDFHRVEGGYLEVLPFTLVTKVSQPTAIADGPSTADGRSTADGPQPPPTVLRCSKGARLKFDNPDVDPLSGKSELESAWLVGVVDIYRPASSEHKDDAIEMVTSNVQLTQRQIFTIDEVQFAFGSHHGSGRQLSMEFSHQQQSVKQPGFESITGFQRIELAYLKQLTLIPKSDRLTQPLIHQASHEDRGISPSADAVQITCAGPFVLDLVKKTATFNDQVSVLMEGADQNQINCKRLTVHFESRREQGALAPVSSQSAQQLAGGSWDLQKLVAEGAPATFLSQTHAAKVTGSVLSYHAVQQEIVAQQLASSPTPVNIVTPDFRFEAVQVAYKLKPEGGLGQLIAQGPGSLLRPEPVLSNNGRADQVAAGASPMPGRDRELLVRWNRVLTIEPDKHQHLISVVDGCQVRFDKTTEIQSHKMQIWLHELKTDPAVESKAAKPQYQYQPDRMLATGDVKMVSPQLNGSTERLAATWIAGETVIDKQTRQSPREISYERVADSSGTVHLERFRQTALRVPKAGSPTVVSPAQEPTGMQPIQRTFQTASSGELASQNLRQVGHQEDNPLKRYTFAGREIDVKLLNNGTETLVQDLTATGDVLLAEVADPFAKRDQPPLVIRGQQLRYLPQPDKTARVLVSGDSKQAAMASTAQFQLRGNQIHLDQAANKLWVDGQGDIELNPTSTAATSGSQTKRESAGLEPAASASPTPPAQYERVTVSWRSGMVFNGRKVYFEDEVAFQAHGKNSSGQRIETYATGQGVTLELNQQVDFQNLNSETNTKLEIREAVIVNQVAGSQRVFNYVNANLKPATKTPPKAAISHRTLGADGLAREQQQFQSEQITVTVATGMVTSKGPGFLAQQRLGGDSLLKQSPTKPLGPEAADGINLVRVNFDGTADANLNEKRMLIRGNVRTLYSSVDSMEQLLDPDSTQSLPPEAIRVKCDRLEFNQWTPRDSEKPVQELLAAGNSHVTSSSFEATADQIRYNQATDTLVVEGTARSDAQLWYHPVATPRERQHLVAQKIIYRPGDQSTEVQGIKNLDIRK